MNFEKLKANLEDIRFYKKNIPNLFFIISFWKSTFKEYQSAQKRAIVPSYLLRSSKHDTSHYNTYALSLYGEIQNAVVDELIGIAQSLDLGEIRFMAHGTNGFFPMVDEHGESVDLAHVTLPAGIYIYTLAVHGNDTGAIACPCAVVITNGQEVKKWAILRAALV